MALSEIADFDKFKSFIRNSIMSDEDLFKMIYYQYSSPLDMDYPENPYDIFTSSNEHGCVLFRRKNDEILSDEQINVLIDLHSSSISNEYNVVYIVVRIICKGENIQELADGTNRVFSIAKSFDNNFNLAHVTGLGEVRQEKFKEIELNSQNVGYMLIYKAYTFSSDWSNNKNFQEQFLDNFKG
jgi:hypothetical protein